MHHHVGAEGERLLQVRARRTCCPPPAARRASWATRGQRGDVGDAEQRVGRRLHPDRSSSAGRDRGPHRVHVGDPARRSSPAPSAAATLANSRYVPPYASSGITTWSPGWQTVRSSVSSAARPLAKASAAPAALQRGQALLQRVAGRVAGRGCTRSPAGARRPRPARRWGLVDRRHHRAGARARAPGRRGWRVSRSREVMQLRLVLRLRSVGGVTRLPVLRDRGRVRCPRVVGVLDRRTVCAFLDTRPVFKGHVLVVPRDHVVTLADLPADRRRAVLSRSSSGSPSRSRPAWAPAAPSWRSTTRCQPVACRTCTPTWCPRTKGDGLRGFFWPRTKYASTTSEAADVRRPDRRRRSVGGLVAVRWYGAGPAGVARGAMLYERSPPCSCAARSPTCHARPGPARPRPTRCRSPTGTPCSARRCGPVAGRAARSPSSAWAASGAPSGCSGSCPGVYSTAVGYAGRLHPEPDVRGDLLRPDRPHRGGPGGLRPGQGRPTRTCSRSSGRTTTRPRACARATTSAPSTARRSTPPPTSSSAAARRPATRSQPVVTRGRATARSPPRSPRLGQFYYAEDYHQQYLSDAKNPNGYCNHGPNGMTCPVGRGQGRRLTRGTALAASSCGPAPALTLA